MRKQVFLEQRTPEWFSWRRGKIGSSDISAILGENPYESPLQKWEQITNGFSKEKTFSMQRGINFEDEAREKACELLGTKHEPACFEHSYKPYIIASLDGWCDSTGCLELKVPKASNQELAESGIVPLEYMAQCQHQMLVTNTNSMFYASYNPDSKNIALVLVKKDNEYCDRIEKSCEEFYRMIKEGIPPDPSENDYERFEDSSGLEAMIREDRSQIKQIESRLKENEAMAIKLVGGRNAYLGNLKITKSLRVGNVNYKEIPELKNVDLEKYRKPSIISYRLS